MTDDTLALLSTFVDIIAFLLTFKKF